MTRGRAAAMRLRHLLGLAVILVASPVLAQVQPCPGDGDCVVVSAVAPAAPVLRGDVFSVAVELQPGMEDGAAGGLDDLAALTFSLGIPGLELADCSNPTPTGLTPAIEVLVSPPVQMIVENTACDANAARPCLCPGPGQSRAPYVNLAFFAPAQDPGQDPVEPGTLPAGALVRLSLRARPEAASEVNLHVFNPTDAPASKPPFGALASIGDSLSVDLSVAAGVSRIRGVDDQVTVLEPATPTRTLTPTETPVPSATHTPTETETPTATVKATETMEATATVEATPTAEHTATAEPTATGSATHTIPVPPTPSATIAAATPSPTPPDATPTNTPLGENPTATPTVPVCLGDCNHDGKVTAEEQRIGVRIALGQLAPTTCDAFAGAGVTVEDLVASARDALGPCAP